MARIYIFSYDRALDRRAVLEAESLIERGHDVTLFAQACRTKQDDPAYVVRVGGTVEGDASPTAPRVFMWRQWIERYCPQWMERALPLLRPLYWLTNGCNPAGLYGALYADTLANLQPADLYIAHDLPMLPVAVEAKKRLGGKVLYDSHELFCEQEFSRIEKRMWQRTEQGAIHNADAVVTVNPSIADELARRYAIPKPYVIYNADRLPDLPPERERIFHRLYNLPENAQVVLFQGGLSHGRNIEMLVRAIAGLPDPVHLVVLGNGPALPCLKACAREQKIEHRVHFHDAVPQADLLRHTQAADLGVIPYRDTCLNYRYCTPNKLFEFVAAGTPMVATALPEIERLLGEHGMGLTGNTANAQTFAALLSRALAPEQLPVLRERTLEARKTMHWGVEGPRFVQAVEQTL